MSKENNPQAKPSQPRFEPVINYTEPPSKPAPRLEAGVLAWIRKNLFGSLLDSFLTIFGILIVVGAVISLFTWVIKDANWFAVSFNFRLFMVGRFQPEYEWRLVALVILVAFTIGLTIAAYSRRVNKRVVGIVAVALLILFLIPYVVMALIPIESSYFAAGNVPIETGSTAEMPQDTLAFITHANETIRIQFAPAGATDETLASLNGFSDVASNTLRNVALTRLNNIASREQLQLIYEADQAAIASGQELGTLTINQREENRADYKKLLYVPTEEEQLRIDEIDALLKADANSAKLSVEEKAELVAERQLLLEPEKIVDTYQVNQQALTLRFYDAKGELLSEEILQPGGDPVTFTSPTEGWYILEKVFNTEEPSIALLQVDGIHPTFQSNRRLDVDKVSVVVPVFIDMLTNDLFEQPLPTLDGKDVPFAVVNSNQYRGSRNLDAYLRSYLAPFLKTHMPGVIILVIAGALGYLTARLLDNMRSPQIAPRRTSRKVSTWLLLVIPILMFLAINGLGMFGVDVIPITDPRRWGGLMLALFLTVFGIILAFPLGIGLALGRRSNLPAVKALCTLIIELVRGSPFITVLFMMQLLIPLISPTFAEIPNVYRALIATVIFVAAYLAENVRGGLQSLPPGQDEAARAVGLSSFQATLFITLPQALRAVIPAIVGQFISLFKDTSLVAIVGLIDLVGVVNTMVVQAEFIGTRREGLIFISIIYFAFSYVMSYISRRIEASGSGAARRF
ncbi:hypothetical protein MASR2M15_28890 [Anaerolineales bacterium]